MADGVWELVLPGPFRVLFVFISAIFLWAIDLHLLDHLGVDFTRLLNLRSHESFSHLYSHPSSWYSPIYRSGLSIASLTLIGLATYQLLIHFDFPHSKPIQLLTALPALLAAFYPLKYAPFYHHLRSSHRKLWNLIQRILSFNFNNLSVTPLSDIILTDVLTSLSKPIGDLWLIFPQALETDGQFKHISPILNSLPYCLRFKQCINDAITGQEPTKSLANAVKYLTSLPCIYYSFQFQNSPSSDHLLLFAVFSSINSIFSTYWDVIHDWGLLSLVTCSSPPTKRISLIFPARQENYFYVLVIALNFILRFSWIFMVTDMDLLRRHVAFADVENHGLSWTSYLLEYLEIFRRSVWCLVRIEWGEISRRERDDLDLEGDDHHGSRYFDDGESEEQSDELKPISHALGKALRKEDSKRQAI